MRFSYDVISSVPVFTQGAVTAAIVHLYNHESSTDIPTGEAGAGSNYTILTTAGSSERVAAGTFQLADGRVRSLFYYGNQYDKSELVALAKNKELFLAKVGAAAGKLGSGLTLANMGIDIYSFSNGDISSARLAYRSTGNTAALWIGSRNPVAGAAIGLSFYGSEVAYDGFVWLNQPVQRKLKEFNRLYPTPDSVMNGFMYGSSY